MAVDVIDHSAQNFCLKQKLDLRGEDIVCVCTFPSSHGYDDAVLFRYFRHSQTHYHKHLAVV
jgi:hypothetical protein